MPDALVRIVFQDTGAEAGANRVAAALGRLERGEPTRVLRQTRLAMDELAVAATGLNPVVGRLAATVAQFGIGGAIGIAAVGGFAAIGLEIKKILEFSGELDKSLLKLGASFATGPSALAFKAAGLRQQVEELQSPGFLGTIRNTLEDMFIGGGSQEGAPAIGRAATLAGTRTGAGL